MPLLRLRPGPVVDLLFVSPLLSFSVAWNRLRASQLLSLPVDELSFLKLDFALADLANRRRLALQLPVILAKSSHLHAWKHGALAKLTREGRHSRLILVVFPRVPFQVFADLWLQGKVPLVARPVELCLQWIRLHVLLPRDWLLQSGWLPRDGLVPHLLLVDDAFVLLLQGSELASLVGLVKLVLALLLEASSRLKDGLVQALCSYAVANRRPAMLLQSLRCLLRCIICLLDEQDLGRSETWRLSPLVERRSRLLSLFRYFRRVVHYLFESCNFFQIIGRYILWRRKVIRFPNLRCQTVRRLRILQYLR